MAFGMDGMEHMGATARTGYSRTVSALGRIYQDVTAVFLNSNASRTPTLFTSTAMFADDRSLIDDPRTRALYPPWEYARLKARAAQMAALPDADRDSMLASLEGNVAEVVRTVRSGGRIISGTDSPIDFNGVSLHMNLRAMVRYGLTPYEALVTATRQSGEFLAAPVGVVQPGAFADLTVVDGDPLSHIEDAAKVVRTIKNGESYSIADLIAPFAPHAAPHAATAAAASPRRFVCETEPEYWWHHPDYLNEARASCCDGACRIRPRCSAAPRSTGQPLAPAASVSSTSSRPWLAQKSRKSCGASGSVASTRRRSPGGSVRKTLAAIMTGSGHFSPRASSRRSLMPGRGAG